MDYFISDTHFFHKNVIKFVDENGIKQRNFDTIEEMNETIVDNWNRVVKDNDTVYHLGDVTLKSKYLNIMDRLKGNKILIKGNHDIGNIHEYIKYFKDICGTRKYKSFLLSHYPIENSAFPDWCVSNVHGHIHHNLIRYYDNTPKTRYCNVCVEHINFTPISYDELIDRIEKIKNHNFY